MSQTPVRAVISDFGGVLTSPLFEAFIAWQRQSGLSFERMGQAMADAAEGSGMHPLYELEKGTISEAEFLRMLEAELEPAPASAGCATSTSSTSTPIRR